MQGQIEMNIGTLQNSSLGGPLVATWIDLDLNHNKKVLLLERKRHTACCVASTSYVVLTGYPLAGYPPPARVPPWQGTPLGKVPPPPGQVPPRPGYPTQAGPGRVPPCWTWQGTPLPCWTWQGTPWLPHGILGNVAKHYGIWVPPSPPPVDRQVEEQMHVKTLSSHRTTYAGSKNSKFQFGWKDLWWPSGLT